MAFITRKGKYCYAINECILRKSKNLVGSLKVLQDTPGDTDLAVGGVDAEHCGGRVVSDNVVSHNVEW